MQKTSETRVRSLDQKDPLEEEMATHPSTLAGESHGQRSLVGYSPWSRKEWDMTELAYIHKLSPFCKVLRNFSPVTQSKSGQAMLPPGPAFLQPLYLAEA